MIRAIFWLILIFLTLGLLGIVKPVHGMEETFMIFNPFSMVVAIVAIAVFGGVLREMVRQRKDFNNVSQKELIEIKHHIAQIEADIADIKEQIADFIIKTN